MYPVMLRSQDCSLFCVRRLSHDDDQRELQRCYSDAVSFAPVANTLNFPKKPRLALYKIAGSQADFGFLNETRSHPMGESTGGPVCSPGAVRGDHQLPVVDADALGGAQSGACRPDDDNADWPARRFRQARAALMHVSALLQGWVARAAEQLNVTPSGTSFTTISNVSSPGSDRPKAIDPHKSCNGIG